MIKIKRLTETAVIPTKGSPLSAGFDLYADEDGVLHAGANALISTGIALDMGATPSTGPMCLQGLIWPRSGLASRHQLGVLAGVIDNDYRGEIKINLINLGNQIWEFKKGERIAQILFQATLTQVVFEEVTELSDSDRGTGGFGSSGL